MSPPRACHPEPFDKLRINAAKGLARPVRGGSGLPMERWRSFVTLRMTSEGPRMTVEYVTLRELLPTEGSRAAGAGEGLRQQSHRFFAEFTLSKYEILLSLRPLRMTWHVPGDKQNMPGKRYQARHNQLYGQGDPAPTYTFGGLAVVSHVTWKVDPWLCVSVFRRVCGIGCEVVNVR